MKSLWVLGIILASAPLGLLWEYPSRCNSGKPPPAQDAEIRPGRPRNQDIPESQCHPWWDRIAPCSDRLTRSLGISGTLAWEGQSGLRPWAEGWAGWAAALPLLSHTELPSLKCCQSSSKSLNENLHKANTEIHCQQSPNAGALTNGRPASI